MRVLELILSLLLRLAGSLEQRRKDQEQEQHEENVDELRKDPANWFDDHFNGVRNNELPDNASEADKTNTGKPKANEQGRDHTKQG